MSKSYVGHLLRELFSDIAAGLRDLLLFVAWVGILGGVALIGYGVLLNLGSFLESPLGIKPNFKEPYSWLGVELSLLAGIAALVRLTIRDKKRPTGKSAS